MDQVLKDSSNRTIGKIRNESGKDVIYDASNRRLGYFDGRYTDDKSNRRIGEGNLLTTLLPRW